MTASNPLAGKPAPDSLVIDVDALIAAYHDERPDPTVVEQRVAFGTSGHRGSSFDRTFNEWHVLAIVQAVCDWRRQAGIDGPLYLGIDTHALSAPASDSAIEVCAANGVDVMLAVDDEFTPTPTVSHAILVYNRGRTSGLADGIVVSPSHNPPRYGGIKYNPPHGGPAGTDVTKRIEADANAFLERKLDGVKRMPLREALKAPTTHRHDYLHTYVDDLAAVVDLAAIRDAKVRIGVDPLGGAGVRYWPVIAERHGLDLTVVSDVIDPTFRFMTVDADGQIRMDPSSACAMQRMIAIQDRFDVSFACDPDHDRHGIVVPGQGLLPPNHYLAASVAYLFAHRPQWSDRLGVGKTAVSTRMIDLVTAGLGRRLDEMPVGFKWFVDGLRGGTLGFAGEESAGATFVRRDGTVWTTDKDGIIAGLLSAEITARTGRHPGLLYATLEERYGRPVGGRRDAPASREQMKKLAALSPADLRVPTLAGEAVVQVSNTAAANGEPIGGIKVATEDGWFAARPSGTEPLYKIYAESFVDDARLQAIFADAQGIVDRAIAPTA